MKYAIEVIGKLNAEVEKLKAENAKLKASMKHDDDTCPHLVVAGRLEAENIRLKAEVDRLAMTGGYHYTALAVSTLQDTLKQKHIDYIETRKANEANVQTIVRLKAEVEEMTKAAFGFEEQLDRELDKTAMLCGQVERLTKAGDELSDWFMDIHPSKKKWNAAKEGKQP